MRLSPHFTLAELVATTHRDIANEPPPAAVFNLRRLAVDLLEPIRAEFGPLHVSSGYRCSELNTLIGGSPRSAHLDGCAADLIPLRDGVTVAEIVAWVAASALPFDQAIDERGAGPGWVHVGLAPSWLRGPPRREALVMRGGRYTPFPRGDT